MAVEDDYRPDLKGTMGRSFKEANPSHYAKTQGDVLTVAALRTVEKRTKELRTKLIEHFKRNKSEWVAREALKIWERRSELQAKHPSPKWAVSDVLGGESIMLEARRNVQAKVTRRFSQLKRIQSQMENAIVRNAQQQREDMSMQHKQEKGLPVEPPPEPTQKKSMRR